MTDFFILYFKVVDIHNLQKKIKMCILFSGKIKSQIQPFEPWSNPDNASLPEILFLWT